MHVLFIHNNYPAQFRHVAPRLASDFGWRCTFTTRNAKAPDLPGVERIVYAVRGGAVPGAHVCTGSFQNDVWHSHGVYEALKQRPDVRPDLVVAHSGFGGSLFVPHLYDAPVVNFFEYFRPVLGGCVGYRPEVPFHEVDILRCRTSNATILLDLNNCDRGWCPNFAQRDAMPREYHHKIEVIPEGVDTRGGIKGDKYISDAFLRPYGAVANGWRRASIPTAHAVATFLRPYGAAEMREL